MAEEEEEEEQDEVLRGPSLRALVSPNTGQQSTQDNDTVRGRLKSQVFLCRALFPWGVS